MQKAEVTKEPVNQEKNGKYLTFNLDREEYGIGILKVKEIIGMLPVTPIPRTPEFVKGVINLRGKVIPVIDMRLKFGLEVAEYTERTCVVVVEIPHHDNTLLMGVVVDSVSEVVNIHHDDIEDSPDFGGGGQLDTQYIIGMAKTEGGVKILMDIDKVLTGEEVAALAA